MKTVLRLINVVCGPILALVFAGLFAHAQIAGRNAADVLGGALAGCTVLALELVLVQGPRRSALLRRWLDRRGVLEGLWIQEVRSGPPENALGIFSLLYDSESDSYRVQGNVYSHNGERWAWWKSTHLFFSAGCSRVTYLWEGELTDKNKMREADKSGLTELDFRVRKPLESPQKGSGSVSHVGERTQVKFDLRRVSPQLLRRLELPFTPSAVLLDANDEEQKLAKVILAAPNHASAPRSARR